MEIRQLESFLAVSETLHFGRAAARVHLSQPALSRQVQQLERELGVLLFERLGRRVVLTAAGRTLAEHARRALDELNQARQAMAGQVQELHGSLAIGCFDSAEQYLIPSVLASLYARHPGLTVSVATLGTRDALRAVREGELDAAIVTLPVATEGIQVAPLFREELVLALPARHPLGRRQSVPLVALHRERLVTFRPSQNTRRLIDQAFGTAGVTPVIAGELESVEAIKDAVRGGLGAAILGRMATRGAGRGSGLLARPLAPPLARSVGLIARQGLPSNRLLMSFTDVVVASAARLGLDGTP